MKKISSILALSVLSVSSLASLLTASTYIANAEENSFSNTFVIPTPPTPPTPPTWGGWWPTGSTTTSTSTTSTSTNSTSTASTSMFKVTILKFINGQMATASSSMNMDFPMFATWSGTGAASGTGNYNLSASGYNGDLTPYQAMTSSMNSGANYSTNEVLGGNIVANCPASTTASTSNSLFMNSGYTTGDTLAQAMAASPSVSSPAFTNMMNNKYVIVWNTNCSNMNSGGQIGGTVTGGATTTQGVLQVTSIDTVNGSGTADGSFANGWKYMFHITIPTNEPNLSMKFADWMSTVGSTTMPVGNNTRISSAQAATTSTVLITGANVYSTPTLLITGDTNTSMPGRQIDVLVETAIPVGSTNGSYTTSYGVKSI